MMEGGTILPLNSQQKKTVLASFLGWTLDAFDFFLLTFLLTDIATEFHTDVPAVSKALFLTLATRFIGAFFFGMLADKYGRKPILMLNIVSYSVIGALAAFSPNLGIFLALRALFGIAMGGEWGLGSSLAMESIPPSARGMVSGILQCGYPAGYLLAAVVYGLLYQQTIGGYTIGWRGHVPAQLPAGADRPVHPLACAGIAGLRRRAEDGQAGSPGNAAKALGRRALCGRADDVLQFLQPWHAGPLSDLPEEAARLRPAYGELDHHRLPISAPSSAAWRSARFREKIGRVNAITIACLIALPSIPLWAYSTTPFMLAIGAFVMQVAVQGAWGVIPVHLNELSPGAVRATLPGFIYQAGNLAASYGGPYQAGIAEGAGRQLRLRAGAFCRRGRRLHHRRHPLQSGKARPGDDGAR